MLEYAAAAWASWMSTTITSKREKVQLEATRAIIGLVRSTPVETVLVESQRPPISMHFQTISLLKADECAHLPPVYDRRQTLFTTFKQGLKRKDRRNTQFFHLNQHGLKPQLLTQTTPICDQIFIPPWDKPPHSQQSSHQLTRECHHPSRQTFRLKPLPPSPSRLSNLHRWCSRIKDSGASLVVLSQDDLVHEWHAPTGTHSSSFLAEKFAQIEAIKWIPTISSWA